MQCVAQASPMIAVSFGALRRDTLRARVRAALSASAVPYLSTWAAAPRPARRTRQESALARAARRRRPEALGPASLPPA
jgi:hypothetical protein